VLKIRVIPTLLYKNSGLVKGRKFDSWRPVGAAMPAIRVYEMRGVDELILLDIEATAQARSPDFELIDDLADECFMPLTVGGGVGSVADVGHLLRVGADKVAINTHAVLDPDLIEAAARRFGSQAIVASIDFKRELDGGARVYTHSGSCQTKVDPVSLARQVEGQGAGEILLTSIERDGCMNGYDIEITRQVAIAVHVPVVASGGAGCYDDMAQVLRDGHASAVAAASIYHFTPQTPLEAKQYLASQGFPVRMH